MNRIMNVIRKIDKWLKSDKADKVLAAILFSCLSVAMWVSFLLD